MAGYDMEEKIRTLMNNWHKEELTQLLVECEMVLSYNEGRIKQLDVSGLKCVWSIITGVYGKNAQSVLKNMQEIQHISFQIQKILLERIDLVNEALSSLNDKVNGQTLQTQYMISRLLRKLEKILDDVDIATIKADLAQWGNCVRYCETADGKYYLDTSDGVKILSVASDLFRIVHSRPSLVDKPFLTSILKGHLGLLDLVSSLGFYSDIIRDRKCLALYVKDYYNYCAGNISSYGEMIYKINEFYSNPLFDEVSKAVNMPLEELCLKVVNSKMQGKGDEVSPVELCTKLLEDLVQLNSDFQMKMEKQAQLDEDMGEVSPAIEEEFQEKSSFKTEYSVSKITPEGLWLYKDGKEICSPTKHTSDYAFIDEGMIKAYLEGVGSYMVTAPIGYFDNCNPEIKRILTENTKYIPLADYYMYLWFHSMGENERQNKKVVFVEYYAHEMYVTGYSVDASGNDYQKGFSGLVIHYTKVKDNIKAPIIKAMKDSLNLKWEDIICFRTFTAEKYIDSKLDAMGVKTVNNTWEDILKTDNNDNLGNIIQDMVSKAAERP